MRCCAATCCQSAAILDRVTAVPVPSLPEARGIVDHLDELRANVDRLEALQAQTAVNSTRSCRRSSTRRSGGNCDAGWRWLCQCCGRVALAPPVLRLTDASSRRPRPTRWATESEQAGASCARRSPESRAAAAPYSPALRYLRRAIHASPMSLSAIANQARIDPVLLDEFLTGERTLRSDFLDRLAGILGYDLAPTRAGA